MDKKLLWRVVIKITQEEAMDPNLVKVLCDKEGYALYFSRAKIPYERENYEESFKGIRHLRL